MTAQNPPQPPAPNADGTVTRPQTPPGQVYVPNPPHPEVYTGTKSTGRR